VIGGLITSTALTLFVLPAICNLVLRQRRKLKNDRDSVEESLLMRPRMDPAVRAAQ